jgi:hypothetical protein
MIINGPKLKFKNGCLENNRRRFTQRCSTSTLIRNYGYILAVIFFHTRALSVEWIRF